MSRFYVIGHPITHSLSPRIHRAFARQMGIDMTYDTYDITPGRFVEGLSELMREAQPRGANVTVPFKLDAAQYCASNMTERAKEARAVNTLIFEDGTVYGDNTDGIGFVRDVEMRYGFPIKGSRVLLLGAGGAARGVLSALRHCACASICVANRTPPKAQALALDFGVRSVLYSDTAQGGYDLIVNCTSSSLNNMAPPVPMQAFAQAQLCYDLFYAPTETPFMRLASESGCARVQDGLGMLVEQAAESFFCWHGVRVATEAVFQELRNA